MNLWVIYWNWEWQSYFPKHSVNSKFPKLFQDTVWIAQHYSLQVFENRWELLDCFGAQLKFIGALQFGRSPCLLKGRITTLSLSERATEHTWDLFHLPMDYADPSLLFPLSIWNFWLLWEEHSSPNYLCTHPNYSCEGQTVFGCSVPALMEQLAHHYFKLTNVINSCPLQRALFGVTMFCFIHFSIILDNYIWMYRMVSTGLSNAIMCFQIYWKPRLYISISPSIVHLCCTFHVI